MNISLRVAAALVLSVVSTTLVVAQTTQKERLQQHLCYLASDSLRGREGGTADAAKAADYIASQFEQAGLKPYSDSTGYFHYFSLGSSQRTYHNVIGIIEGNDPVLKDETVIIGAHYDHLGVRNGKIYHGADDNASGSSAVIEMARRLVERRSELKRTVMLCAFDAEEIGLCGSDALAQTMVDDGSLERVKLMVSMDMVGWYRSERRVNLAGYGTIDNGKRLIESIDKPDTMNVELKRFETFVFGATDTESFATRKRATLAVDTGLKSPYHKPEDTADKIDYDGLDAVTDYMTAATVKFASTPTLETSGRVAKKHHSGLSLFEAGITAGAGTAFLSFPNSSAIATTRTGFAYNAGVWGQINFGNFGVRADGLFESRRSKFPTDVTNMWEGKSIWKSQSVTVPAAVVVRLVSSPMTVSVSAGGYWSYLLSGKVGDEKMNFDQYNRNEWGVTAGFEVKVSGISVGWRNFTAVTDATVSKPTVSSRSNYFTLGYTF